MHYNFVSSHNQGTLPADRHQSTHATIRTPYLDDSKLETSPTSLHIHLFMHALVLSLLAADPPAWSLAFGSCHHQDLPAPALTAAASLQPDAFVWLGDNFYNDLSAAGNVCEPTECTTSRLTALKDRLLLSAFKVVRRLKPKFAARLERRVVDKHNGAATLADGDGLSRRYAQLSLKPEYLAIRNAAGTMLATWDDHDFCRNNAGKDCPVAQLSRELFLNFWRGAGALEARGGRAGVYDARMFGEDVWPPSRRVQVLLLDLRSFRSELERTPANTTANYPEQSSAVELLGEEQWAWLEAQLHEPAAVRVLCSSISFAASYTGEEAWSLYPHERLRMLTLIRRTGASGVVFVSGDVHYGEVSAIEPTADGAPYTLYDVTSSGLTQSKGWHFHPPNARRVASTRLVKANNFGVVDVDWAAEDGPRLLLSIRDEKGEAVTNLTVPLSELGSQRHRAREASR